MKSLGSHIVINYHYIHNPGDKSEVSVFPCSVKEFEKQIKYLSENYKIVSVGEVYRASRSGGGGKFCAITFDDGLKDHYANALPILKKYNAAGTFFIITGSLKGRMSLAHKVHAVQAQFSAQELVEMYNQFFKKETIPRDRFLDPNERYDDIITSNFKTTLIALPRKSAESFLLSVFADLDWQEEEKARRLFMGKEEIKELEASGMIIGAHGESHDSFLVTADEEIKRELASSKDILGGFLKRGVSVFSYPHGQYGPGHPALIKKAGFEYGVTTRRRALSKDDDPLLLPRYDTNDLKDALI